MFTAKEKDDVLNQIDKSSINPEDAVTNEIIRELQYEGLVHAIYITGGKVHACRLLPKGELFLERGGYTKLEKDRSKAQNKIWWKESVGFPKLEPLIIPISQYSYEGVAK